MNDAPKPPPVIHAINCVCGSCCAARAAEARRRIEDARREERAGREAAHLEAMPVAKVRRPSPGSRAALVRRYGRVG